MFTVTFSAHDLVAVSILLYIIRGRGYTNKMEGNAPECEERKTVFINTSHSGSRGSDHTAFYLRLNLYNLKIRYCKISFNGLSVFLKTYGFQSVWFQFFTDSGSDFDSNILGT